MNKLLTIIGGWGGGLEGGSTLAFSEVGKVEEGLIYDQGLMGEGSGLGEGLYWAECHGFQASLNNDTKSEYVINQSDRFSLSAMAG